MVKTRRFRGGKKSKRHTHHKHHSTHRRKVKRYSRRGTKRRQRTKRVKRGGGNKTRKIMVGGGDKTYFLGLPPLTGDGGREENIPLEVIAKKDDGARFIHNSEKDYNVKKALQNIGYYDIKHVVYIGAYENARHYMVDIGGNIYNILRWSNKNKKNRGIGMFNVQIEEFFKEHPDPNPVPYAQQAATAAHGTAAASSPSPGGAIARKQPRTIPALEQLYEDGAPPSVLKYFCLVESGISPEQAIKDAELVGVDPTKSDVARIWVAMTPSDRAKACERIMGNRAVAADVAAAHASAARAGDARRADAELAEFLEKGRETGDARLKDGGKYVKEMGTRAH